MRNCNRIVVSIQQSLIESALISFGRIMLATKLRLDIYLKLLFFLVY
jgi:hypothetical protein